MDEKDVYWKAIALKLAQRVNFAISNIEARGSGIVLSRKTGYEQHWTEYMAEPLTMIPGVTLDSDLMAAVRLSGAARRKALEKIRRTRSRGDQ